MSLVSYQSTGRPSPRWQNYVGVVDQDSEGAA